MSRFDDLPWEIQEVVLHHIPLMQLETQARLPYLLVCKKWMAVLEPRLFSAISLIYTGKARVRVSELLNFFGLKPHLTRHVRVISLVLGQFDNRIYECLLQLLSLCTCLQDLSITADVVNRELPPIYNRSIREGYRSLLKSLKDTSVVILRLDKFPYDIVIEALNDVKLDLLEIRRAGGGGYDPRDMYDNDFLITRPTPDIMLCPQLQQSYYHAGLLKSLDIAEATITTHQLSLLLQWPSQLERFSLGNINLRYVPTQSHFDDITTLQNDSLVSLHFLAMIVHDEEQDPHSDTWPRFHVGHAPKLKTLHMTLENTVNAISHNAPGKRPLSLGFIPFKVHLGVSLEMVKIAVGNQYWCHDFDYWDMIDGLLSWIEYMKELCEQRASDSSASCRFKTIHIYERANWSPWRFLGGGQMDWPYDFLVPARETMSTVGVDVIFSGSHMFRDNWTPRWTVSQFIEQS